MKLPERDSNGKLPAFAWPGGYPVFYLDKQGNVFCPDCASREVDASQEVADGDVNWEDADLDCDDCGKRIECAYPPESTLAEAAYAALALMRRECDIRPEADERMLDVIRGLESALAREARP